MKRTEDRQTRSLASHWDASARHVTLVSGHPMPSHTCPFPANIPIKSLKMKKVIIPYPFKTTPPHDVTE